MKGAGLAALLLTSFLVLVSGRQTPAPPPSLPRLILVLSIDQMRFDYLTRFSDSFEGGLRRLTTDGAIFSNARYRHAGTETGPGHSVILSGRHPSSSGIVANDWWDPLLREELNVVDDPVQNTVGGPGRAASPANFIGFTLGDVLKLKNPGTKVVGIAIKDRAAVLMGGRRADAAYWFETEGGNFISSTYYMPRAPEWLTAFNARRLADAYHKPGWTLLRERAFYEQHAGRDDMPGEGYTGRYPLLPKPFPAAPPATAFYTEFRRTPFAEEMMLEFAVAAMNAHQLGEDPQTDIFALGFSALDYVSHDYGPDSQETMDELLRLDRLLEKLFQHIDGTVGLDNTLIVATADHGALPLVEVLQQKGVGARRASRDVLLNTVREQLRSRFGVDRLIAKTDLDVYSMYFDEDLIRQNGLSMRDVETAAAEALMSTGYVDRVYTRPELMDRSPAGDDPFLELHRNSFFASRSGHVVFRPKPYLTFYPKGTSHGSPHDYDRHVPIIFAGPQIRPGTYSEACGPEDIAPTLAKILGVDYPKESDSRLLLEMLR